MKGTGTVFLVGLLATLALPALADGKEGYQRCAACHLADGQGIPGAFPPLKDRVAGIASVPVGRAYLVHVVNAGLMGQVSIDGVAYMGVMPAQSAAYDAGALSDVLNYAVQVIDGANVPADWQPYSSNEVEALLGADNAAKTPADSAKMRQQLLEKHPEFQ